MEQERFDPELDDFLSDLHRLLDDVDNGGGQEKADPSEPAPILDDVETPVREPEPEEPRAEAPESRPEEQNTEEPQPRAEEPAPPESAEPEAETPASPEEPAPAEEPAAQPEEPKGLSDKEKARELVSWTQKQRLPRHVAKLQKNQEQAYAEWVKEQEAKGDDAPPPDIPEVPDDNIPTPRKKGHGLRNLLIFLVIFAVALTACAAFLLPQPPDGRQELGRRREDAVTLLLMGKDASGARTDAMVLLSVDGGTGELSLISLPGDTLVKGNSANPRLKLKTVFGANGGGSNGIDMVNIRVSDCIGFMPDGYVMVDLQDFADFVDLMGGVEFDVPVEMQYRDKAQDLTIDLKAGVQTLSGKDAAGLMQFSTGYPDADLGRVRVQQSFLSALLRQVGGLRNSALLPQYLNLLLRKTETNLSAGNLLWLAKTAAGTGLSRIHTATLPGNTVTLDGESYYVLDADLAAQTVNAYCNPYEQSVTAEDLDVLTE